MEIVGILILAVAWATTLAAGAALVVVGLRGRVVDWQPRCRCNYLLVGFEVRPARCPECGAALANPGQVRLGRRSPRVALSILGIATVLAALSPVLGVMRPAKPAVPAARPGPAPPPVAQAATPAEPDPWGAGPTWTTYRALDLVTDVPKEIMALHSLCAGAEPRDASPSELVPAPLLAAAGTPAPLTGNASAVPTGTAPATETRSLAPLGRVAPLVLPRLGIGPLPARGIGTGPIASRIDPRRVDDRRVRASGPRPAR